MGDDLEERLKHADKIVIRSYEEMAADLYSLINRWATDCMMGRLAVFDPRTGKWTHVPPMPPDEKP